MPSDVVTAEVAVVGLGAMGAAALYQLARRGVKAVGVDRFAPPHDRGSSHGETRITRQAVGEGEAYAPFVRESHRVWRRLEAETGRTLLIESGVLVMASVADGANHHGRGDFIARTAAVAERHGIAHETLDAAGIAEHFPQFTALRGDEAGYFEPGGGYVFPEACVAAQLERAAALGARVLTNTPVPAVRQEASGVRIETPTGAVVAERAVVAAGAWTAPLLGPPFDRLLAVNRQVLHWFDLDDPSCFPPGRSPTYIRIHGKTDTDYFYGFPPLPGERRVKVATEQYAARTTADALDHAVRPEEQAAMFREHIKGRLAGVSDRPAGAAACLYTVTPDRGFVIDRHPEHDRLLVVSACSGHGFKHSAGVGHAVAELMAEGRSRIDLSPFALDRFANATAAGA